MRTDDLLITIAYFSIPVQILVSLYQYPRLQAMPWKIFLLVILFALFVFLCGFGHLFRCLGNTEGVAFEVTNMLTAIVSLTTAAYLLPLTPSLMGTIDQTMQELVKLNEETEESRRQLQTFMAFLCHEIRNPLFAITASVDFMGDEELTAEQSTSVESIKHSAELMLRLVNDVLDISKLESSKIDVEIKEFNLLDMFKGIRTSVAAQLQQRHEGNVEFRFDVDNDLPRFVEGDRVRILQIVYNLLSNAIKFTERGFVYFQVLAVSTEEALREGLISAPETDNGGSSNANLQADDVEAQISASLLQETNLDDVTEKTFVLKLKVQDTGIGISPESLENIFKPYCQAKMSQYRKLGGTGLGLSIVSKLVQFMGGKIKVRSHLGEGSTFEAYIPLRISSGTALNDDKHDGKLSSSLDLTYELESLQLKNHTEASSSPTDIIKKQDIQLDATPTTPSTCATLPGSDSGSDASPEDLNLDATQVKPSSTVSVANESTRSIPTAVKKSRLPKFNMPEGNNLVLIVDDNATNRRLLTRMLSSFNLQFEQACNGQEAVDIILNSRNYTGDPSSPHFGLIFMDLSMPVMDGYEAMATLREHNLVEIPIVALTAGTMEGGGNKALAAGATEYATKPIRRDALHEKCRHYLFPQAD